MLIRSQNKKAVFDMSNCFIGIISENRENCICIKPSGNPSEKYLIWGRYQTEERAIEVLDEICNAYVSLNKCMGKEFRGNNPSGYFGGYVKNGVYQMPEV